MESNIILQFFYCEQGHGVRYRTVTADLHISMYSRIMETRIGWGPYVTNKSNAQIMHANV